MSVELKYLAVVTLFTGLIWVPYILNTISVRGMMEAVGYPENPRPIAAWAARMKLGHSNAVENLVIFAGLVLVAHAAGVTNQITALASAIYFWARVVHLVSYTFAIPWIRTLAFAIGFGCQMTFAWQILS